MTFPHFPNTENDIQCFHCGELCLKGHTLFESKHFCCDGCKTVFQLLQDNGLCGYYDIDTSKGISPKLVKSEERFAYLDDEAVQQKILSFQNESESRVDFSLPMIHCSSCVWLLEHLYKLDPGIISTRTDFNRKSLHVVFQPGQTTLRKIVELLATIGYEPDLRLSDLQEKKSKKHNRRRIYRLVVAGFCFGNIMLLSFPEYLSNGRPDHSMNTVFSYLNLLLSLPVLAYSGGEFFISAIQGLKAKFLNIDLPLSLSLAITFGRSSYEIISGTGAGYLDSMSGIIFFMLVGRYFQDRTHLRLQFDRDFKSFFPISVRVKNKNSYSTVPLSNLKIGDRIFIRSQELIPADAKLISGDARVDYSFVTGESSPEHVAIGSLIYAGGRQTSGEIEIEISKEVEQSYLTRLWNREENKFTLNTSDNMIHRLARHFTMFLILLSIGSFLFWLPSDMNRGVHALTTILIVACPCALLLSATFTHASVLSVLGKNGVFVKNALVLEAIGKIDTIAWDKTGTLTSPKNMSISDCFDNRYFEPYVFALTSISNHPLSRRITEYLEKKTFYKYPVTEYREYPGLGIEGTIEGHKIKIGNASFVKAEIDNEESNTIVYVSADDKIMGHYHFGNDLREGIRANVEKLTASGYSHVLISGDKSSASEKIVQLFPSHTKMYFGQSPHDKQEKIELLRQSGHHVLMIGDGLNDAGALLKSDAGIAVSDDINNFTPACDVIMEGNSFNKFESILRYIRYTKYTIIGSFILSLLYNIIGLGIAIQGQMSPLIAAILMPVSSVTIILFTTCVSRILASQLRLKF